MTTILCPTRGGPRSYANQDRAAALAKENDATLIFLYINDVTFLNQVASPILVDMEAEMEEMGEFLLTMAQDRAAQLGVEAQTVVRRGVFSEVIGKVIRDFDVDILLLGSSGEEEGLTTPEFIRKVAQKLATKHNIEVMVLHKGEILATVHR